MSLELQINDRIAHLKLISRIGNMVKVDVDGRVYEMDLTAVGDGLYSVIHKGISYNMELIEGSHSKSYFVNTFASSYEVEIIDAEARYRKSRKGHETDQDNVISSPMPGKIVKIPVKIGQEITAGTAVIIVSAMKMESEYKVQQDCIVKEILVKEGDTVDGNQALIIVE
ncbi:MAG: acetyl-CoA carboxylase biotin carboxyl carrier protein subunit [Bacteroidales bacterium]|nr:acetyl-CoA carboxylase biotin carboxyl carrier protein subunit [Bacteroidales bacterium]